MLITALISFKNDKKCHRSYEGGLLQFLQHLHCNDLAQSKHRTGRVDLLIKVRLLSPLSICNVPARVFPLSTLGRHRVLAIFNSFSSREHRLPYHTFTVSLGTCSCFFGPTCFRANIFGSHPPLFIGPADQMGNHRTLPKQAM